MALFGVLLGAFGVRFWWHGLAALFAITIVLIVVGTTGAMNDQLVQTYGYNITPATIARGFAIQFSVLLLGYGAGAGGRWIFQRLRQPR